MSRKDSFTPDHLTSKGILACPCGRGAGKAGTVCPACGVKLGGPTPAVQAGERAGPGKQAGPVRKRATPNKTEQRFKDLYLRGWDAVYEGLTVTLPGEDGRRYTCDWVVRKPGGQVCCYEVKRRFKGGARLLSYRDARGRFDAARAAWPMFEWYWAELQSDGEWVIS